MAEEGHRGSREHRSSSLRSACSVVRIVVVVAVVAVAVVAVAVGVGGSLVEAAADSHIAGLAEVVGSHIGPAVEGPAGNRSSGEGSSQHTAVAAEERILPHNRHQETQTFFQESKRETEGGVVVIGGRPTGLGRAAKDAASVCICGLGEQRAKELWAGRQQS